MADEVRAHDRIADDDRWFVVNGRRWRRTDPCLPEDIVDELKSQLGRGRSAVRLAMKAGDPEAVARARQRVGLAKQGLGERGAYWWNEPVMNRRARADEALRRLHALDVDTQDH